MVFKRRDRRPIWKVVADFIYPKGGWARAFEYVKHRVRRLPDTPEKIGRGVWAGVFAAFTPFYGFHFVVAAVLAKIMRGNILAALMATFFGNPLTYIPIGVAALSTGHWLLGTTFDTNLFGPENGSSSCGIGCQFSKAFADLWFNLRAVFTGETTDWTGLASFYAEVFYPYLVGGVIPGVICATLCYILVVPLVGAYQNRRRKKLREKLDKLKNKSLSDNG